MANFKQLPSAITMLLNRLEKKGSISQEGKQFKITDPGELIAKGDTVLPKGRTQFVIPKNLKNIPEEEALFSLGNLDAISKERVFGAKSPATTPLSEFSNKIPIEPPKNRIADGNLTAEERFANSDFVEPRYKSGQLTENKRPLEVIMEMITNKKRIGNSDSNIDTRIKELNSASVPGQIDNISRAVIGKEDLTTAIDKSKTYVPKKKIDAMSAPIVEEIMRIKGLLKGNKQEVINNALSRGPNNTNLTKTSGTGQVIQALGSMGSLDNSNSQLNSKILSEYLKRLSITKDTTPRPTNITKALNPSIDGEDGFSRVIRTMEAKSAGKQQSTRNEIERLLDRRNEPIKQLPTIKDGGFGLGDFKAFEEQQTKVNEVIQLLSLIKQGKIVSKKGDLQLIQQLLKQEKQKQQVLFKQFTAQDTVR